MNKTEVIAEISQMTNISVSDCEKVLDAFEDVLGGELNRKGWKGLFCHQELHMSYMKHHLEQHTGFQKDLMLYHQLRCILFYLIYS